MSILAAALLAYVNVLASTSEARLEECRREMAPLLALAKAPGTASRALQSAKVSKIDCRGTGYLEGVMTEAYIASGDLRRADASFVSLDRVPNFDLIAKNEQFLKISILKGDLRPAQARATDQIRMPETRGPGYFLRGAIAAYRRDVDSAKLNFEAARDAGELYVPNLRLVTVYFVKKNFLASAKAFDAAVAVNDLPYGYPQEAKAAAIANFMVNNRQRSRQILVRHLALRPEAKRDEDIALLLKQLDM